MYIRVKSAKTIEMAMLLPALLLTGCGKTIPECGDPSVLTILNTLTTKGVNSSLPTYQKVSYKLLPVLNLQEPDLPDFFEIGGVTVKSDNLKLEGFSSTKKDKDSGMNYCTAIESGELTSEIQYNVSKKYADSMDVKSMLSVIADTMTKDFIPGVIAESNGNIKSLEIKPEANTLVFRFIGTLPSSIIYQANLTDKGDQVLVNVIENK